VRLEGKREDEVLKLDRVGGGRPRRRRERKREEMTRE